MPQSRSWPDPGPSELRQECHLSLGNIAFALDAVIVILGTVIVSRDVDSLIYGLIVSYLLSLVMDKVMYGIDEGKLALIVTDPEHSTEICFKIDEVLGRGSTILNGMFVVIISSATTGFLASCNSWYSFEFTMSCLVAS